MFALINSFSLKSFRSTGRHLAFLVEPRVFRTKAYENRRTGCHARSSQKQGLAGMETHLDRMLNSWRLVALSPPPNANLDREYVPTSLGSLSQLGL